MYCFLTLEMRRISTQDPPEQQPPIIYPNRLLWSYSWLHLDNPRCPTALQISVKLQVQQAMLQQWHTQAPHSANPSSIMAVPASHVLARDKYLQKPDLSLAMQLQTRTIGIYALL
jgi:hypothetical protein